MLRYLSRVEVASDRRIQWGILTNGRHWRLYYQKAANRAEEFIEFDLPDILGVPGFGEGLFALTPDEREHLLTCFILLFQPQAFLPDPGLGNRTFHEFARTETKLWEAGVAKSLSEVVFQQVFPTLIRGFVMRDSQRPATLTSTYLDDVRQSALVFLYRLLFVLHAEDRDLLPVRDDRYANYALRRLREEVARRLDAADAFSTAVDRYYGSLRALFAAIATGDDSIGIPPYNGGLFDDRQHPLLGRLTLCDADFAVVLDALSRQEKDGRRLWINYRDLSVQQLGSIYERLLEYRAVGDSVQAIRIEQGTYARRVSGSYFTDESLVQLVLRRTVGPLIDERQRTLDEKLEDLRIKRRPIAERLAALRDFDPATHILELKICDPAMGSGHFLVSLVDYLTDRVLQLISEAVETARTIAPNHDYLSPVVQRSADIRQRILQKARDHGWPVREEQLDDRHIIRRMVLKRVIYGVDLNPMAVELAKLSLWLHSFTVGAPLSFLNHHLRHGNSLVGTRVQTAQRLMQEGLLSSTFRGILAATDMMSHLEEMTDADIAEVEESASTFTQIETTLIPYRQLLDLDTAHYWVDSVTTSDRASRFDPRNVLKGDHGDPLRLLAARGRTDTRVANGLSAVSDAAADYCFFHWELMFPEVRHERGHERHDPGFDAVIGNPPWDRIKLQEVEFFAERRPDISSAQTAAQRTRLIAALKRNNNPLWVDYRAAAERADRLAEYARHCGEYPLLATGDINLYALFVERAYALIRSTGLVGLVVPSGIAADKEKAEFFGGLATSGRLNSLLDFENKGLFPDIDSRFKFSVLVGGGVQRTFPAANCAFYLHDVAELDDGERSFGLTPDDFAKVNPNTRTAPVFRTRRDADITKKIYSHLPVLVDRRQEPPSNPWGIRYSTMFHMTNDSGLFRTKAQLERDGFYPVASNRWRKDQEEYVPLYEGKMVQMYDHRAASVIVNPDNVHRPGQPQSATPEQHANPNWTPEPQFWVPATAVRESLSGKWPAETGWYLGFKEITSPTNMRGMIAAFIPAFGSGNKYPLLLGDAANRPLLAACLNSFPLDYVLRQKLGGQTINLFILEQLPLPDPSVFERRVNRTKLSDFIRGAVLRLTYTAHDMAALARDLAYDGPPFAWDDDERRHLCAQLDALMFRLYELDLDEADYVLSTFPIVQRHDEEAFGRYRTRDLILAYMRAQAAGDFTTRVAV